MTQDVYGNVASARVSGSGVFVWRVGFISSLVRTGVGVYEVTLSSEVSEKEHVPRCQSLCTFSIPSGVNVEFISATVLRVRTVIYQIAADLDFMFQLERVYAVDLTDVTVPAAVPSVAPAAPDALPDYTGVPDAYVLGLFDGAPAWNVPINPRRAFWFLEDYYPGVSSGITLTAGGGASGVVTGTTDQNTIGVLRMQTTGAGQFPSASGNAAGIFGGGTYNYVETRVQMDILSSAADRFVIHTGFGDNIGAGESVDSIEFRYTDNVNGGNWQGVCRSNSVESVVNSAIPPVANVYQRLTFVVDAAGTSVEFFIDGVSIGTINTNIPTGATRVYGLVTKSDRTVASGVVTRQFFQDYWMHFKTLAR